MIPAKSSNYDLPDSYDNIEQTLITADQILSDAVENAKTLFHSPTVSSIEDSKIVSRVMVLREFNLKERFMRFHTDYRAPKIKQYKQNSTATVLGYDPILKVQIKLQGKIESHYHNSVTRNAWDGSTTRSKKCYSVNLAISNKFISVDNLAINLCGNSVSFIQYSATSRNSFGSPLTKRANISFGGMSIFWSPK